MQEHLCNELKNCRMTAAKVRVQSITCNHTLLKKLRGHCYENKSINQFQYLGYDLLFLL